MSNFHPVPKPPKRKHKNAPTRRTDEDALQRADRPACQVCGTPKHLALGGLLHRHHIKSRGAGGADEDLNLICLCALCHTDAHSGKPRKEQLLVIKLADLRASGRLA
jgi:5-methylcytosine-specific restriction endonuclease McrA